MGRRGPLPHSSAALRLRGSWRAQHRGEPAHPAGKAQPPAWLSEDARAEWDRLAPELEKLGLLTELDVAGFSILCNELVRYRRAVAELAISGETYEHGGLLKINPWARVASDAVNMVLVWAREFGCSPTARARLGVEPPEAEGALEKFLRPRDHGPA